MISHNSQEMGIIQFSEQTTYDDSCTGILGHPLGSIVTHSLAFFVQVVIDLREQKLKALTSKIRVF